MTRNEARTEAIVAKWDSYYDEHGGRREPRRIKRTRHPSHSVESMLEIINANNSKRDAGKRAAAEAKRARREKVVAEWLAAQAANKAQVKSAETSREKEAAAKPERKPRAKRARTNVGKRTYSHYGAIIVTYPDGREAQYETAREAAKAVGATVAAVYHCISGSLRTIKGATIRTTATEHRHNCVAVIGRYPDGRVIRYPSITDAAKQTGGTKAGIWLRMAGRNKTPANGIKWERAK